jgi:hypothetical protein
MSNRRQVSRACKQRGQPWGRSAPRPAHTTYEIGQCIWPISPTYLFNALNNSELGERVFATSCISHFFHRAN